MINGLEGIPGSGKSYEATVFHVLHALQRGRKVITNLPLNIEAFRGIDPAYADLIERRTRPMPVLGTWDPDRVDESGNGQAFELVDQAAGEEGPKRSETIFGGVWDYYTTWKHPTTGQGPLFVIDECHNALPKDETDRKVVEWYKLHRHFNVDVLLMTQSFRDMDQSIARLVANLVRVRKADILGRKDSYIRKVHAGYRGGLFSQEERKYDPEKFRLYQSHTQGNAVAESSAADVAPFIVKFNRLKWAVLASAVVATVWAWWPSPPKSAGSKAAKPAWIEPAAKEHAEWKKAGSPQPGPEVDASKTDSPKAKTEYPEPYGSKGLHLTGRMTMGGKTVYTFLVSQQGQPIGQVVDADLLQVGYKFRALSDCAGVLTFGDVQRMVLCDSPTVGFGMLPIAKVNAPGKGS